MNQIEEMLREELEKLSIRDLRRLIELWTEINLNSFEQQRMGEGDKWMGRQAQKNLGQALAEMETPLWFREIVMNMGRSLLTKDLER